MADGYYIQKKIEKGNVVLNDSLILLHDFPEKNEFILRKNRSYMLIYEKKRGKLIFTKYKFDDFIEIYLRQ